MQQDCSTCRRREPKLVLNAAQRQAFSCKAVDKTVKHREMNSRENVTVQEGARHGEKVEVVPVCSLRMKALPARALTSRRPRTDQLVRTVLLLSMNQSTLIEKPTHQDRKCTTLCFLCFKNPLTNSLKTCSEVNSIELYSQSVRYRRERVLETASGCRGYRNQTIV